MESIPTTQKAWVYEKHGPPSQVLKLNESYPIPKPSGDELLVRVKAVSLNPVDWKTIDHPGPATLIMKLPATPGSDFSGVIVGGPRDGEEIYGIIPTERVFITGRGTLAQYVLIPSFAPVQTKPPNISFDQAGSVALAGLTSWMALVDTSRIKSGDRVFINGGSSGTGLWGVQLAKALGGYVVTTCSESSFELVKNAGADELIDYKTTPDLAGHLSNTYSSPETQFDIIYECVGTPSNLYDRCPAYLKKSGTFVDITAMANVQGVVGHVKGVMELAQRVVLPSFLGGTPRTYKSILLRAAQHAEGLKRIDSFMREGKITPILDSVHPFEKALDAFERQITGRAKGKVVISFS